MGHLIMTDYDPDSSIARGRRALADDGEPLTAAAPRRATVAHDDDATLPRRALADPEVSWQSSPPLWLRHRVWVIAVVGSAVVALLIWMLLPQSAAPPPPPSAVPVATSTPPSTTPSGNAPPTFSSIPTIEVTPPPLPSAVPPIEATTPDASSPAGASSLPEEEPAPSGNPVAGEIILNDAQFNAPEGWSIYADEEIEDDRRAVRLKQDATDARLQAVTLEASPSDLASSCESLVTLQQAQFTEVTRQLVVGMGVDSALGTAARCGFSGTRTSDGVNNTVTFTLVMRTSDSHILLLRHTVPDTVEAKVIGVAQLNAMTCGASSSFGVPIPLC